MGARAYSVDPSDGEEIKTDNLETPPSQDFPIGCECFTKSDDEANKDWFPPAGAPPLPTDPEFADYSAALLAIQDSVYHKCFAVWTEDYPDYGSSSCSETSYTPSIVVWRRSGLGERSDCSLEVAAGGTTDAEYDPGNGLTCSSQGHCTVSPQVVEQFSTDLWIAGNESAYGVFGSGGLKLAAVAETDLTFRLGLRTSDVLLDVNGKPLDNLAHAARAIEDLVSASVLTLHVRRGARALTYVYHVL